MKQNSNFLTFDRLLNIHQSLRAEQNFTINKALLRAQLSQNEKLSLLNKKLSEANFINKQILENQIIEIKRKEEQRFYKSLFFKCFEIINFIKSIENDELRFYFIQTYSPSISYSLNLALSILEEITDKNETKKLIDAIVDLNKVFPEKFSESPLYKLNDIINDYETLKDNLNSELLEIKSTIKSFPIPKSGLLGLNNKNRIEAIANRDSIQKKYEFKEAEKNNLLEKHKIHDIYNLVNSSYPDFEEISNTINEIEIGFSAKFEKNKEKSKDPLFKEAAKIIVQNQIGSASLLQRRLKLSHNRAERLINELEDFGIIGLDEGLGSRKVLIKEEAELNNLLQKY